MTSTVRQWGEKEWEGYANGLLSIHYSLQRCSYQRIPATSGGDCGLEGISDTGEGYQSYADQNSKDNADRLKKQQNKVRTDLKKLEQYKTWWESFLGKKKIRRWVLVVPYMDDKKIVQYTRGKARELFNKKSVKFLDPSFEGAVMTADDFPAAARIHREPTFPKTQIAQPSVSEITQFETTQTQFVSRIDAKLLKGLAKLGDPERKSLREQLLRWHLRCSNYLGELRAHFPALWEELNALITTKGDSIATESILDVTAGRERLNKVRLGFVETLKSEQKYLQDADRDVVSWGVLAKWLGECPLSFPDGCHA